MQPKEIALILIDIQKDFWQPLTKYSELKDFPNNVSSVISFARENGFQIIHVKSVFKPDKSDWMMFYRPQARGTIPCIKGSDGVKIEDFAKPIGDEIILEKQTFDAFLNTELYSVLDSLGVKVCIFVGLETSVCILFSATSAYLQQLLPIVISNACADEPSRHSSTIRMYNDLCFKSVSTEFLVDNWDRINDMITDFVT